MKATKRLQAIEIRREIDVAVPSSVLDIVSDFFRSPSPGKMGPLVSQNLNLKRWMKKLKYGENN